MTTTKDVLDGLAATRDQDHATKVQAIIVDLREDMPARRRIRVPKMAPEKGDACCWHCLPDSIEPECAVHSGYTNG